MPSSSEWATRACTPMPTCARICRASRRPSAASGCSPTGLPHRPGVYLFRGPSGEVLYVGTAVDLRRRVGQYFNGADPRGRMKEMVDLATAVDHVECAHALEAGVRELRLLAAHAPPYNRRSRFPHRWWWLALTDEAFPRLAVVRAPRHDRAVGPFRSRADAADTAALLARFTGLRTCTARLGRSVLHGPACPEAEVSACPGARNITATQYAAAVARVAALIDGVDNSCSGGRRGPGHCARRATSFRERRATARPHRHRRRDLVARPAVARAGRFARADRRCPGRRRWLPPRRRPARPTRRGRHRRTRGAADASRRRDSRWGTGDLAGTGSAGRCAGRGDRTYRALAGHPGGAHRSSSRPARTPRAGLHRCDQPAPGRHGLRRRARHG